MNISTDKGGASVLEVAVNGSELVVHLRDGRTVSAPLSWFPSLLSATPQQRANFELIGDGEGIHWPDIDEDLSLAGLLRGVKAPPPENRRIERPRREDWIAASAWRSSLASAKFGELLPEDWVGLSRVTGSFRVFGAAGVSLPGMVSAKVGSPKMKFTLRKGATTRFGRNANDRKGRKGVLARGSS